VGVYTADGNNLGQSISAAATWQVPTTVCQAITPVQKSTWSAVKSLYR